MITSAIKQIVNTDRTELKDFLNEVDKFRIVFVVGVIKADTVEFG
jgi:hypothetical protein